MIIVSNRATNSRLHQPATEQIKKRCLSTSRRSHKCQNLPGIHRTSYPIQDILLLATSHPFENHLVCHICELQNYRIRMNFHLFLATLDQKLFVALVCMTTYLHNIVETVHSYPSFQKQSCDRTYYVDSKTNENDFADSETNKHIITRIIYGFVWLERRESLAQKVLHTMELLSVQDWIWDHASHVLWTCKRGIAR